MSEDILDQIDNALADVTVCFCGCKTALRATSPSPWFASEECQALWAVRQIRVKSGIEKAAEQVEAAADASPTTWTVNPDPVRYRCRTCGSWLSLDVPLCGPCGALPPCSATRWAAVWDATAVCLLPARHSGGHESVEGRTWGDRTYQAPRPFLGAALDSAMESVTQDLAAALDELVERARAADGPSDPSIDVSRDGYYRYGCPQPGCDWAKVTRYRPHLLDDLIRAHDLEQHAPRSWWRRILPRASR
jgi:hypothetical protein